MRAAAIHIAWANLPIADVDTIVGRGRTLILAPHPDDESLGCGGLIAELCRQGRTPLVVVLTDGTGSHPGSSTMNAAALQRLREQEATDAVRALGLTDTDALVFMRLRDTAAPHAGPAFEEAVTRLAALAADCETICAPWAHDPHCDHVAAHLMACAVAARTGIRHRAYPVWGWTLPRDTSLPPGQARGWRLDIARDVSAKRSAVTAHRSQHGCLIDDDPEGFTLPSALLTACLRPYEVYLKP